jgi:drug/metabolite transporter (DMT)-like permease
MKNNNSVKRESRFLGEFVLLAITLLWGSTFVIVKQSLTDISPVLYVAIRFTIASIVLFPIYLWKREEKEKLISKPGVFLGAWLFLGFIAQTIGLRYTTATKSGFITGTFVVMIPIFQIFIEKKKPSKGTVMGVFVVFVGLLFLSSGGNSVLEFINMLGRDFNWGDLLTLISAVFFSIHIVYLDKFSREHSTLGLLSSQFITVSVFSVIAVLLFASTGIEQVKADFNGFLVFSLLFTALIATLFNIGLQTKFQKTVSPAKAGIIYSLEPLFSAILAFFVLNEKISNFGYIGSALIFAGLLLSEVYDNLFNKDGKESAER